MIEIEYYTDPLCCWSWAFEPQWRRLRYEFKEMIQWRYRMAGLLPSWKNFSDPLYSVNRPLQMGPVWMEAQQMSGQPMHDRIWGDDPPQSSYPACIAVKCASLQSAEAEEAYLRRLREAIMLEGKNIAKEQILFEQARQLAAEQEDLLDAEQLLQDYHKGKGQQAFREDLQKMRYGNISRFPTLILRKKGEQAFMITGYRPYAVLLDALRQVDPTLSPAQQANDADTYASYWGSTTEKETEEALAAR
ncbi:DsbA family protein [Cesiribacter sp. SM1]|uniref:DsbA family protein n=1 Tax=Cesiribacter sp. SM1 TaxID=2861196 RepID=UPI001CD263AB|nr:DsbA family protein [Cesiribacter sp. SM1]